MKRNNPHLTFPPGKNKRWPNAIIFNPRINAATKLALVHAGRGVTNRRQEVRAKGVEVASFSPRPRLNSFVQKGRRKVGDIWRPSSAFVTSPPCARLTFNPRSKAGRNRLLSKRTALFRRVGKSSANQPTFVWKRSGTDAYHQEVLATMTVSHVSSRS